MKSYEANTFTGNNQPINNKPDTDPEIWFYEVEGNDNSDVIDKIKIYVKNDKGKNMSNINVVTKVPYTPSHGIIIRR